MENIINENIFSIIEEIFLGIEKKLYSMIQEKDSFRDQIKTREAMLIGINYLEVYLNQVYKHIIDNDDEFICSKFKELGDQIGAKPVFALNLLSNTVMRLYPLFTRSKLNTDSEVEYLNSVQEIMNTMKNYSLKVLNEDLNQLNEEKGKK